MRHFHIAQVGLPVGMLPTMLPAQEMDAATPFDAVDAWCKQHLPDWQVLPGRIEAPQLDGDTLWGVWRFEVVNHKYGVVVWIKELI